MDFPSLIYKDNFNEFNFLNGGIIEPRENLFF